MIERHASGIRAGRFFAFESPLPGDGNAALEAGGLPVRAMLFKGFRAGRREEVHEGRIPPLTLRAGVPLGICLAPGEAS